MYRRLMILILLTLLLSAPAFAEKFVISAINGLRLAVITCELKPNNRIVVDNFNFINIERYDSYNTAVAYQKVQNSAVFNVYFPVAKEYDGPISALEMYRLDSYLNLNSESEFNGAFDAWNLDISRGNDPHSFSRFLFSYIPNNITEFRLTPDGTPGHQTIAFKPSSHPLDSTVAQDGRMIAVVTEKDETQRLISIQKLHPFGKIKRIQTPYVPTSLALTDPIEISTSNGKAKNRFLFFREFKDPFDFASPRIMMQKIDDIKGAFIGTPKLFTITHDKKTAQCCFTDMFYHSVAVATNGRIVFYNELDDRCGKNILKAQVFDPETSKKLGVPQLIMGCEAPLTSYGLIAIDVAQFEP